MRLALIAAVFFTFPAIGFAQTTWYVPDDFPAGIQSAISDPSVFNGDTIIVRPGSYVENIDFLGKNIRVASEKGPSLTIIDGGQIGSAVTFENSEGPGSVLQGFTIRNGSGIDTGGYYYGGGIYCFEASPTITGNAIEENSADYGGGIYCTDASATMTYNTIKDNIAYSYGGGLYCSNGTPLIDDNIIYGNRAAFNYGGGIRLYTCNPASFTNNLICQNTAGSDGGGIATTGDLTVMSGTICDNVSAGYGGGIHATAALTIGNSILWGNVAGPGGDQVYISGGTITATYTCAEGGLFGTGNIDSDPLFADPAGFDYHLTWDSPCRNAGDDSLVTNTSDFEGNDRICDTAVDMGADEYWYRLYLTGDPVPSGTVTFKVVGIPSTNPVKIYRGQLRSTPLTTQYGMLYIKQPFPHIFSVGPVPANGIATTTKTIPSGVTPGSEFYFQALHGPLANSNTKLTNLMTVTVE